MKQRIQTGPNIRQGGFTRGCAGVGGYEDAGGLSQGEEGGGRGATYH